MEPTDQQNNQSSGSPQIIKPEALFSPSVPPQAPPPNTPVPQSPQQPQLPPSNLGQRKKILMIAGGVIALLILISVIALATSSNSKKNGKDQAEQPVQSTGIIKEPTAIDIENANNSISSDITGLNDDNDFPPSNLTDENLEL